MNEMKPEERIIGQMNNSLYFTIPADVVAQLNLKKGETLTVKLQDGEIVASPKKQTTTIEDVQAIDQMIDKYMAAMQYLEDK
ncbi:MULTISPECIES: AbrB/MazE/SpoVT family DNA-binding domain-containing protein [unclassified Lacticaseibacillus]|uniref:AbrB/MazE/SpoVT family DNA-binding domain-containing protein n=1 Tax=unclassified Lacticaseibacillus TaxID=2759744 RepID=UPI00194536D1|nr:MULTISPECIES: AbrB/MazE/SpoVT family DNA-binding domain-containing protein [unclassified Lacticaseibacillus]